MIIAIYSAVFTDGLCPEIFINVHILIVIVIYPLQFTPKHVPGVCK